MFENACQLAKTIPSYTLDVSLTGEFWKPLEELL
jgi:hypothetical protein